MLAEYSFAHVEAVLLLLLGFMQLTTGDHETYPLDYQSECSSTRCRIPEYDCRNIPNSDCTYGCCTCLSNFYYDKRNSACKPCPYVTESCEETGCCYLSNSKCVNGICICEEGYQFVNFVCEKHEDSSLNIVLIIVCGVAVIVSAVIIICCIRSTGAKVPSYIKLEEKDNVKVPLPLSTTVDYHTITPPPYRDNQTSPIVPSAPPVGFITPEKGDNLY